MNNFTFANYRKEKIPQFQNGRVINLNNKNNKNLNFLDNSNMVVNNKNDKFKFNVLKGIQSKSRLSMIYFSQYHIDQLNDKIRYNVWLKSDKKIVISRQNELELMIIMRAMFLQHSRNLDYNIAEQVQELDDLIIRKFVPKLISEVLQYKGYINDIEYLPVPIDRPVNLSSKGTKILKSVTTTF